MWDWKNRNQKYEKYNWSVHTRAHTHTHGLNGGLESAE